MLLSYNSRISLIDNSGCWYWRKNYLRATSVWQFASNRIIIYWNRFGQPVGKSPKVLGNWISSVAHKYQICPLNLKGFKNMPDDFTQSLLAMTMVSYMLSSFLQYLFISMFLNYYIFSYRHDCILNLFVLRILANPLISLYWNPLLRSEMNDHNNALWDFVF